MVGRDELVIVVPPGHKWARRSQVVTARELAETSLVAREPHSGINNLLMAALRDVLGDVQQAAPVLELTSAAAMSKLAVADDLAVGRLQAIAIPELNLRRTFRAFWIGGHNPPAEVIPDVVTHIISRTTASK